MDKITKLKFLKRFMIVGSTVFLAIMFLAQGYKRIEYYLSKPTYISTSVVKQQEATFPTFTMCPEGGSAYKQEVLSKHGLNKTSDYNCGSKGVVNTNCPFWTS
jgi:hypothetical protein